MQRAKRRLWVTAVLAAAALPVSVQAESLTELYQLAVQNDLSFQAAKFQRDVTLEAKPQAWAALLPQVGAEASIRENRFKVESVNSGNNTFIPTDEGYQTREYALNLSQALFNWPAFKTLAQADSQVAQAQAAYRAAEQDLIVRLVQAYFSVLSAQDTLRADIDAQTSFKQQLDQQQEKYRAGVATVTDAKNALASYDSGTAVVIADRNALSAAKRALSTIVGRPIEIVDPLQDEITLVPPNPVAVESWVEAAANNNFQVISARYAAEASRHQTSAARGAYLPTLSAIGALTRQESESRFGYDGDTDYIGLNLNLDLFRGGQVASVVREAQATEQAAETQYRLQLRTSDQNVRDHYDSVVNGIAQVRASAAAVASNQSSVIATEVGFKVGTRTIIDVLNTRQTLASAQKNFSESRYEYLLNLLQLKSDVGQLAAADIVDIERLSIRGAGAERSTAPAARKP